MSPSEFDLRAALHDGEGDVPDASRIIATVARARYERRRRIVGIGSAAAAVAVVATGITLLARTGNTEQAGSGGGVAASAPAFGGAGHGYAGGLSGARREPASPADSAAASAERAASQVPCPTTLPHLALPGAGGTTQFGADGPLFSQPVAAMKVCSYGVGNQAVEFSGTRAKEFADYLEQAPVSGKQDLCKLNAPSFALYAVSASGARLPVVTAQAGCAVYNVTNGTAVRLLTLQQLGHFLPTAPPAINQGSPVKS